MENKSDNGGLYFFTGIILLAVGLFMLTQQTDVTMVWYTWRFNNINLASGVILIPFIIGVVVLFFNPKSLLGKILTIIGVLIIIATIIMSINIVFRKTSLFALIVMLVMIFGGLGLLLRWYFKRK